MNSKWSINFIIDQLNFAPCEWRALRQTARGWIRKGAVYLTNAKCGARDVDDKGDEGMFPLLPPPTLASSLAFFFLSSLSLTRPSLNYLHYRAQRFFSTRKMPGRPLELRYKHRWHRARFFVGSLVIRPLKFLVFFSFFFFARTGTLVVTWINFDGEIRQIEPRPIFGFDR